MRIGIKAKKLFRKWERLPTINGTSIRMFESILTMNLKVQD